MKKKPKVAPDSRHAADTLIKFSRIYNIIVGIGSVMLLLFCLICPVAAWAEPVIMATYNNQGSFSIAANNLNRVIEAEIRIDYQSVDPVPPVVSSSYMDRTAQAAVSPGSIIIPIKSKKPLNGYVSLAIVRIRGSISYLTAQLRYADGSVATAQASIRNPSQDQLDAIAAQIAMSSQPPATDTSTAGSKAQPDAGSPPASRSERIVPPPSVTPATVRQASPPSGWSDTVNLQKEEEIPQTASFSRHESLLERFKASSGERTITTLTRLLVRNEGDIIQDPPLLLSDGSSVLKLTVQRSGRGTQATQFLISGGNCTNFMTGENGAWILEIMPERGTLTASVTVLAGSKAIEYPLAVAPPLELFDETAAGADQAEFVGIANELVQSAVLKIQ